MQLAMASTAEDFKHQQAKIVDLYRQVSDIQDGDTDDDGYLLHSTIVESDRCDAGL